PPRGSRTDRPRVGVARPRTLARSRRPWSPRRRPSLSRPHPWVSRPPTPVGAPTTNVGWRTPVGHVIPATYRRPGGCDRGMHEDEQQAADALALDPPHALGRRPGDGPGKGLRLLQPSADPE